VKESFGMTLTEANQDHLSSSGVAIVSLITTD
jgi:hypothetical protein